MPDENGGMSFNIRQDLSEQNFNPMGTSPGKQQITMWNSKVS